MTGINRRALMWEVLDTLITLGVPKTSGRKVCVIRTDAIGDFIVWLPYAARLREHYAGKPVILVCAKGVAAFAKSLPYWDKVVALDLGLYERDWKYRRELVRALRQEGIGETLMPMYCRTVAADRLVHMIGAPSRLGVDGDDFYVGADIRRHMNRWYTKLLQPGRKGAAEWEHAAACTAGVVGCEPEVLMPAIPVLGQYPEVLKHIERYFVIFPGASVAGRRWPAERFVEAAKLLVDKNGWTPVVAGGPGEEALAKSISDQLGEACINLAGKTSLQELVEAVRSARLLLTNETSAAHIGAATRTPTVCIVGGGHFGRFMPYPDFMAPCGAQPKAAYASMPCFGCNWHCKYGAMDAGPVPCVSGVEVAQVIELAEAAYANAD
jgi:ADP-heptose:LPS heptosyltransferase